MRNDWGASRKIEREHGAKRDEKGAIENAKKEREAKSRREQ